MSTTLIHSDFTRRSWIASDGARRQAPNARRASALPRDDFEIAADSPRRIADLLLALENAPAFCPSIILVRGEYGGTDRVRVDHAGEVYLLSPSDARLVGVALDTEQAFPGCMEIASRLREAAHRIDFGRDLGPSPDKPGVLAAQTPSDPDEDPPAIRSAARTLLVLAAMLIFVALMVRAG